MKKINFKKVFAGLVLYNVISLFVFLLSLTDDSLNDYLGALYGAYLGIGALSVLVIAGSWAIGELYE